jgi:hypothetical protein
MTPEGRVKEAVKRWLKERGVWYYMPVQNGMGVTGIPDFVCCWHGRFMAIETKAPGKRANVSANKERHITGFWKAGGVAIMVDDVAQLNNLEDECKNQANELSAATTT